MTTNANLVLTDGMPTPVARTFGTGKVDGEFAHYSNRVSGILIGYGKLQLRCHEPVGNEQFAVAQAILQDPILEVTAGSTGAGLQAAPTVAYTNRGEIKITVHRRSTEQEKKNLRKMMIDLLDEAIFVNMVEKSEHVS